MVALTGPVPTLAEVAQAKEDYHRACEVLKADLRARSLAAKQGMVGQCFTYLANRDDDRWLVYIAVVALEELTAQLTGWHFQQTARGTIEIAPDADLEPGFLTEQCDAIPRDVFVAAFNEVLTAMARYAHRMP